MIPEPGAQISYDELIAWSKQQMASYKQFATTVGIHSCNIGVPILVEEMARHRGTEVPESLGA